MTKENKPSQISIIRSNSVEFITTEMLSELDKFILKNKDDFTITMHKITGNYAVYIYYKNYYTLNKYSITYNNKIFCCFYTLYDEPDKGISYKDYVIELFDNYYLHDDIKEKYPQQSEKINKFFHYMRNKNVTNILRSLEKTK